MEYGYNLPVHMYKDGADDLTFQPSAYRGRTEMFFNEVAQGNLSFRLKDVRVSDRGQYKCFMASNDKHNNSKVTLDVTGVILIPDALHPRVLQEVVLETTDALVIIFQYSVQSGRVAMDWRVANSIASAAPDVASSTSVRPSDGSKAVFVDHLRSVRNKRQHL
eukprot:g38762.t1